MMYDLLAHRSLRLVLLLRCLRRERCWLGGGGGFLTWIVLLETWLGHGSDAWVLERSFIFFL